MASFAPNAAAYLTADVLGIGGRIRARVDDFLVEELPAYETSGEGEHLYLFIEKTSLTTAEAARRIARSIGVRQNDVSYAGMKDKHAVTRQLFSCHLPGTKDDAERLANLNDPAIKLLWADRHGNKLRRGHLAGNRFVLRIRGVEPTAVIRAKRALDQLIEKGVPNAFGSQRFGNRANNHQLGALLIKNDWQGFLDELLIFPEEASGSYRAASDAYARNDYDAALDALPHGARSERSALVALKRGKGPRQAVMAIDRNQRELYLTAAQSAAFNALLAHRMSVGCFDKLVPGDLAWKHDNGAVFSVDEETAAKENAPDGRIATKEVSPSGPLWGTRMTRTALQPDQWEQDALATLGLTVDQLENCPQRLNGVRRPLRVPLENAAISGGVDESGPYVRLSFDLPAGAFATTVLAEIMKPENGEILEGPADAAPNAELHGTPEVEPETAQPDDGDE